MGVASSWVGVAGERGSKSIGSGNSLVFLPGQLLVFFVGCGRIIKQVLKKSSFNLLWDRLTNCICSMRSTKPVNGVADNLVLIYLFNQNTKKCCVSGKKKEAGWIIVFLE